MARIPVAALVLALAGACTGAISEVGALEPGGPTHAPPVAGAAEPGAPVAGAPPAPPLAGAATAGPRPLRRLTRREYDNTVRDLLGDTSAPASAFPDELEGPSGFPSPTNVSIVEAGRFLEAAEKLAAAALPRLAAILPCDPAAIGEAACAARFIDTFGRRAFRRPLTAAEKQPLEALYATARERLGFDFRGAVGMLLQAILQSPRFLYHWEGDGPRVLERGLVRLGPWEIASRLSYFLWSTMPDDALFAAAAAGKLATPAEIEAQARRMLAHPRAREPLRRFYKQWLELEHTADITKDAKAFPTFTPELRAAMAAETEAFLTHVTFEGDGKLTTLLTAPYSFVNAPLAQLYGVPDVTGAELARVALDPGRRAGILTQAAFLATHSLPYATSPVQRGKVVRLRVLCQDIPPPPPDVSSVPPRNATSLSRRALYVQHSTDPACAGCHALMDPIGFGFEHYDGIGAYRTHEGKLPIDASGVITALRGGEARFANAIELAQALARAEETHRCLPTQLLRALLDRREEEADQASLEEAYQAFRAAGLDIRALLVALTRTPGFRYRAPVPGEVLP